MELIFTLIKGFLKIFIKITNYSFECIFLLKLNVNVKLFNKAKTVNFFYYCTQHTLLAFAATAAAAVVVG